MMQNVFKNCPTYFKTPEEFETFQGDIFFIHMSKTSAEYLEVKALFKKTYSIRHREKAFRVYAKAMART